MNTNNDSTRQQASNSPSVLPSDAVNGSVTPDALIVAFVQGAQWWEWRKTGATMWASDRNEAEYVAEIKASTGTLGKSPNDQAHAPATKNL